MKHTFVLPLAALAFGASLGTAHAQRAPISREDRHAQRRQSMENMTPEQRQQFFQNQRQQRRAATGANQGNAGNNVGNATQNTGGNGGGNGGRTNRNRNSTNGTGTTTEADHESRMRALMKAAGITDKAQQDPIIVFVLAEEKARQPLIVTARAVATSLKDGKTTPEQLTAKWTTYQTELDQDRTRYKKDLADLDTKIGWSKNPRLESFLNLVGVATFDSLSFGGVGAIFVDAPTNRSGRSRTGGQTGATAGVPTPGASTANTSTGNNPAANTPAFRSPSSIPPPNGAATNVISMPVITK